jgi:N-acetylglutamate synthase-like GNAT family acetyltransferase
MIYHFRTASINDIPIIWTILQQAILRRKNDGSNQWQDGYPNLTVIQNDIKNGYGHVLLEGENIIGYCAIAINDEPEYLKIDGSWLTNADFVVFHRVAISTAYLGKNLSKKMIDFIEGYATNHNIKSLKADTNYDNFAMMKILGKSGFKFCGIVYFRGSQRRAYEKILE